MKMIDRYKIEKAVGAFLIFFWLFFLTRADSYYSPYLLIGMTACYYCFSNDDISRRGLKKGDKVILYVFSILLALTVILANYRLFIPSLRGGRSDIIRIALLFFKAILFLGCGIFIFREVLTGVVDADSIKAYMPSLKSNKWFYIAMWAVIVLTNSVILIFSQYPGILTTDSKSQMSQLINHVYSNHHPYYHTQIIHAVISLGMFIFGDITKAVALYSLFSIVVMATCFIYVVKTIYDVTENLVLTLLVYVFYLIMPFHIMYSMTMWKDVFFGASVVCFAVSAYRTIRKIGNSRFNFIALFFFSMGMALLRSNGWTAFLLSTIIFSIIFNKKQKKMILMFFVVLVVAFVLKHPVLKVLNVSQPDTIESLSIPAQQIARVIADGRELTEEQEAILSEIVDIEKIPGSYSSHISDPIKNLVRAKGNQEYITEHAIDLLKVYIQLGLKYPHKYVEAWIDETRGYWNGGYSYWRWSTSNGVEDLGINQSVKSPVINALVHYYLAVWDSTPLELFLCIGLYVWIIVIMAYRVLKRKDMEAFFVTIPFLAVIASLMIATPVFSEFRYAYAVFCGLPFVVVCAFAEPGNVDNRYEEK